MRTLTWEEFEGFQHWVNQWGWYHYKATDISVKTERHYFSTPQGQEVMVIVLKKEENLK
jgi:hypothetical protein